MKISEQRLRVLISGHLPPPMGGIAAFCQELLSSQLGHYVDISFVVTSSQQRTLSTSGQPTFSNLISAFKDCIRFGKAILKSRPHVAHVATAFGLSFLKHSICVLIARMLGVPVLLHPHCSFRVLYLDRSRLWKWYVRKVLQLTSGVIALSHEWQALQEVLPGCQVYPLPNSINLAPYRRIAQARFNKQSDFRPLNVFYMGCIGQLKGTFDLVKAAASVDAKINFVLAGEEQTAGVKTRLQELINALHIQNRCTIHPPVFGTEKLQCLQDADIFVYPSYHEGMPMAVIEAMACGLPIIATRVGGLPDLVIEEVNGLLVSAGAPDEITNAISRIAQNSDLRVRLQKKSYQIASEQFDIEQRVPGLVKIYEMNAIQG